MIYSVITTYGNGRISIDSKCVHSEHNLPSWWGELDEFNKKEYDAAYRPIKV